MEIVASPRVKSESKIKNHGIIMLKRWIAFERRLKAQSFGSDSVLANGYQGRKKMRKLASIIVLIMGGVKDLNLEPITADLIW